MLKQLRRNRFFSWILWLEYAGVRLLAGGLNALPLPVSLWLGRCAGDLLYLVMRRRRQIALDNLNIAYAGTRSSREKRWLARESFRSGVMSLLEFLRIPRMLRDAEKQFLFEGTETLDSAFKKGHGVVLVISHLGSWECLAFLPYLRGYPCSVIVREIRNPYLYPWIQRLRAKTKLNPIDRKNSVRQIMSELKKNHLVAILIDQWAGSDGLWIEFFGKSTSTTAVPARLARKTGASLVPAYCVRQGAGKFKIRILPEVPLDADPSNQELKTTVQLNRILESEILKHPEQWAWVHRRWKETARYRAAKKDTMVR